MRLEVELCCGSESGDIVINSQSTAGISLLLGVIPRIRPIDGHDRRLEAATQARLGPGEWRRPSQTQPNGNRAEWPKCARYGSEVRVAQPCDHGGRAVDAFRPFDARIEFELSGRRLVGGPPTK